MTEMWVLYCLRAARANSRVVLVFGKSPVAIELLPVHLGSLSSQGVCVCVTAFITSKHSRHQPAVVSLLSALAAKDVSMVLTSITPPKRDMEREHGHARKMQPSKHNKTRLRYGTCIQLRFPSTRMQSLRAVVVLVITLDSTQYSSLKIL